MQPMNLVHHCREVRRHLTGRVRVVSDLVQIRRHPHELAPVVPQLFHQLVTTTSRQVRPVTQTGRVQRRINQDRRQRPTTHLSLSLQQRTLLTREIHRHTLPHPAPAARTTTTIKTTRPARHDTRVVGGARHRNHPQSINAQRSDPKGSHDKCAQRSDGCPAQTYLAHVLGTILLRVSGTRSVVTFLHLLSVPDLASPSR